MATQQTLRFQPFSSDCEASFWAQYGKNKLDVYRLSDEFHSFSASYSTSTATIPRVLLSSEFSFESPLSPATRPKLGPMSSLLSVSMKNFNTVDEFKDTNKQQLLTKEGEALYNDIVSGKVLEEPFLLSRGLLLSYVDLKKHNYIHWFAFPTFQVPSIELLSQGSKPLSTVFDASQLKQFATSFYDLSTQNSSNSLPDLTNFGFFTVFVSPDGVTVKPLSSLKEFKPSQEQTADTYSMLGFLDPSGTAEPGWPLRNALYAALCHAKTSSVKVLCFRDPRALVSLAGSNLNDDFAWKSMVIDVQFNAPGQEANGTSVEEICQKNFTQALPTVVGWEKNQNGKLLPRQTNLSSMLDGVKVMDAAVDLNLKLMRWRVLPNLDVKKIQDTKVLLVGSGTLGCNVARSLLAWGVKTFSFIDNGRVSYSNPVRQSLFTYEDCANGGKFKVDAAAEAIKKIYPGVTASGHVLSIPMPGHQTPTPETLSEALLAVDKLHSLIESHDVVYLLTDSRESRWLPTLICQALNKPCINAALGFNSYVVMRHGARPSTVNIDGSTNIDYSAHPHLGCYFCSDVVAPSNSLRDRTLDQQCTVTRPGLSMISSGLVAEMTVAMLHHAKHYAAPASAFNAGDENPNHTVDITNDDCAGVGVLPHQLRGDMYTMEHQHLTGGAQSVCSACGSTIVTLYHEQRHAFITDVLNKPGYLEEVSGLAQLQRDAELALAEMEQWEGFGEGSDCDDF